MKYNKYIDDVQRVRQPYTVDRVRLHASERDTPVDDTVWCRFTELLTEQEMRLYPNTDLAYARIGEHLRLPENNITLYEGSDRGLRDIFQVFCTPNSTVVTTELYFPMYGVYTAMYGARLLSTDNILDAITEDTSIVVLSNPNSPLGYVLHDDDIDAILDKCIDVGCVLVLDEAYIEFSYATSRQCDITDNLIVLRTFSKAGGSAGARIGYSTANARITELLKRVSSMNCLSAPAVAWLIALLDNPNNIIEYVNDVIANRKTLYEGFSNLGIHYLVTQTNFMHVQLELDKELYAYKECTIDGTKYARINIPGSKLLTDHLLNIIKR